MAQQVSAFGITTATTPTFSTTASNELVLAFVASDVAPGNTQTATVSGAGLSWSLVKRANTQPGDAEIWQATAPNPLSNVTVTSTATQTGKDQFLTVLTIDNAAGVGAAVAGGGSTGAPQVKLTTQATGSLAIAVGNDFDHNVARTAGSQPGARLAMGGRRSRQHLLDPVLHRRRARRRRHHHPQRHPADHRPLGHGRSRGQTRGPRRPRRSIDDRAAAAATTGSRHPSVRQGITDTNGRTNRLGHRRARSRPIRPLPSAQSSSCSTASRSAPRCTRRRTS